MKRVIQTVLVRDGIAVKGKGFAADRPVGSVRQALAVAQAREEVDEVVLLDCAATRMGRGPDFDLVEQWAAELRAPLAVGGGIRSLEDVDQLMRCGADKVVIGTRHTLIDRAADKYGAQAVVASIDVGLDGAVWQWVGERWPIVFSPLQMAGYVRAMGAGEILLQSVPRDGCMIGYDLDLIRSVCEAVNVPVIASGGCASAEDAVAALKAGASAVAIGAAFLFTDLTPRQVKESARTAGIGVRL